MPDSLVELVTTEVLVKRGAVGGMSAQSVLDITRQVHVIEYYNRAVRRLVEGHNQVGKYDGEVLLVLGSKRQEWFGPHGPYRLPVETASYEQARLYGNVVLELMVPGTHNEVCAKCGNNQCPEFTAMLLRYLDASQAA